MFVNPDDVANYTSYIVTNADCQQAQYVIESYVGRTEPEIDDFRDIEAMRRAVAYQAAYMSSNPNMTYEQAAVAQTGHSQMVITFKNGDFTAPWLAPLAVMQCRRLTWFGTRSVSTAPARRCRVLFDWTTD